jgi:hypothetical protein
MKRHTAPEVSDDIKKAAHDERQYHTARLGEASRFIGFGLLAVFYTIISGDSDFANAITADTYCLLMLTGVLGTLTILFDYLHYVAAHLSVQRAIDRKDKPFAYNKRWFTYRVWTLMFYAKQAAAVGGAACFVLSVVIYLALHA